MASYLSPEKNPANRCLVQSVSSSPWVGKVLGRGDSYWVAGGTNATTMVRSGVLAPGGGAGARTSCGSTAWARARTEGEGEGKGVGAVLTPGEWQHKL